RCPPASPKRAAWRSSSTATPHAGRPAAHAFALIKSAAGRPSRITYNRPLPTKTKAGSMDKVYAPHEIERRIYERWESSGWFAPRGDGPAYSIVIPPPNVTGTLHLGHAFQQTLMDALTRYHRMRCDATLWQPGADHAGIATQM